LSNLVFGARTAVLLTWPAALLAAALGAVAGGAAGFWGNTIRLPATYWLLTAGGSWWALQLPVPLLGLAIAAFGVGMALVAGRGKRALPAWPVPINAVVMGAATGLDTIPRLVLVVAIAAGAGVSTPGLLALLALTAWPHPARLVRAQMLRVRTLPFVEAARAAGVPAVQIWLRHALPHALQPLRTALPLSVAGLLGLESTLSFLGIGLPPDVASWGRLMATVRDEPGAWWTLIFPAFCLFSSILSLHALSRQRPASR
jgi:peptide/nickel transport system permease protein